MNQRIYLSGGIGESITFIAVKQAIEAADPNEPVTLVISSVGGGVYQGLAIYHYLMGRQKVQEINTHGSGIVASMASVIFLAGRKRTLEDNCKFLIHCPLSADFTGDADAFEREAKELREHEFDVAKLYALGTGYSEAEALAQMKKDTYVDHTTLIEKGIIHESVVTKAVASIADRQKYESLFKNDLTMTKKEKKAKAKKIAEAIRKGQKAKKEPVNILVTTSTDAQLEFEREEGVPQIGDMATVDGEPAQGTYVIPQTDGSLLEYIFEDGELIEIVTATDEDDETAMPQNRQELQGMIDSAVQKSTESIVQAVSEEVAKQMSASNKSVRKEMRKFTEKVEQVDSVFNFLGEMEPKKKKRDGKKAKASSFKGSGKKEEVNGFDDTSAVGGK